MAPYRANAIAAGMLFIVATASGIASVALTGAAIGTTPDLAVIGAHANEMTLGALLVLVMGAASAGIAFALYPVLRLYGDGPAIASAGFRAMEGLLDIIGALLFLTLLSVATTFVEGDSADLLGLPAIASTLTALHGWISHVGVLACWCVGALIYYAVFFRTRLVPRWLSGWGILGLMLTLISILLYLFGFLEPMSGPHVALNLPIAVQEMVFAIWLIARGFEPEALKRWILARS